MGTMGLQLRPAMAPVLDSATSSNMTCTSASERWEQLAKDLWLDQSSCPDVKAETLRRRIWDPLEAEAFNFRSLAFLESLQILERYGEWQYPLYGHIANEDPVTYGPHLQRKLRTISLSSLRLLWVSSNERRFRYGVSSSHFRSLCC